jgi:hypothetical protein
MTNPVTSTSNGPVLPEIDESDLKAARRFLTSFRDEERRARMPHNLGAAPHGPTVRNGIARARVRAASKPSA